MRQAVAKCPSIKLKLIGESALLLLDSGSIVSLMQQDYLNRYFRLKLGPAEASLANADHMFNLTSVSGGAYHCPDMWNWKWNFKATGARGQILDCSESK